MTLEELYAQLAPRTAEAFRAAIADITDNVVLQRVIDAVERGDVDGAFKALDFNPSVFNRFYFAMVEVMQAGANFTLSQMPKRVNGAMLRFNVRDRRAEEWLQNQSSKLITAIENDTRASVSATMANGLAEGRNPRNVALDIVGRVGDNGKRSGGVIGLGAREEEWSRAVRQKLSVLDETYFDNELRGKGFDRVVRAAIASGKPLTTAQVDRLVDKYRENALRHRGETIARTETLAALNKSEWLSLKQSVERGEIRQDAVERIWDTAGDNRVRHTHREMNGQRVGIDEPFISPSGARLMHPGDVSLGAGGAEVIACRCRVRTFVDWSLGVT